MTLTKSILTDELSKEEFDLTYLIKEKKELVIGRGEDADIKIPQEIAHVLERHAIIKGDPFTNYFEITNISNGNNILLRECIERSLPSGGCVPMIPGDKFYFEGYGPFSYSIS